MPRPPHLLHLVVALLLLLPSLPFSIPAAPRPSTSLPSLFSLDPFSRPAPNPSPRSALLSELSSPSPSSSAVLSLVSALEGSSSPSADAAGKKLIGDWRLLYTANEGRGTAGTIVAKGVKVASTDRTFQNLRLLPFPSITNVVESAGGRVEVGGPVTLDGKRAYVRFDRLLIERRILGVSVALDLSLLFACVNNIQKLRGGDGRENWL